MDEWRSGLIVALFTLFFIHSFAPFPIGETILGVLTVSVIVAFIPITKRIPKMFGTIMLVSGGLILVVGRSGIDEWTHNIIRNVPLVTLIVLVPILAIPFKFGGYDKVIEAVIDRYRNQPPFLFFSISVVFFILGPIINLGSIRLVDAMLAKLKLPVKFLGKVYVRGFTSVITWSPYFAAVLLVIYYLDISITDYLFFGILLGFTQLIVGNILFLKDAKEMHIPDRDKGQTIVSLKLVKLISVFLLLTVFIFLLENILQKSMILIVSISVIIFSFLWSVIEKSLKPFLKELNQYRKATVLTYSNEIVLFLTAGFFGVSLSMTPVGYFIQKGMRLFAGYSELLLIFLTIMTISIFAMCGVHQIVTVTSIASSVNPVELGLDNIVFALILMSAWSVSSIVSPVTPVNVVVTSLLKRTVFEVAFKWNGLYAIIVALVHTYTIFLIDGFLY